MAPLAPEDVHVDQEAAAGDDLLPPPEEPPPGRPPRSPRRHGPPRSRRHRRRLRPWRPPRAARPRGPRSRSCGPARGRAAAGPGSASISSSLLSIGSAICRILRARQDPSVFARHSPGRSRADARRGADQHRLRRGAADPREVLLRGRQRLPAAGLGLAPRGHPLARPDRPRPGCPVRGLHPLGRLEHRPGGGRPRGGRPRAGARAPTASARPAMAARARPRATEPIATFTSYSRSIPSSTWSPEPAASSSRMRWTVTCSAEPSWSAPTNASLERLLVEPVALDDLAAHPLHGAVHRLVGLQDPARLAAV